jgi:hypothetical protein
MNAVSRDVYPRLPADEVEAVLNYTRNAGERPVNYGVDPPKGAPRRGGELDPRVVTIHNARTQGGLNLDRSGFELLFHMSSLSEWRCFQNPARVRAIDYPEVEEVLRIRTRAQKVVIFEHTLRDSTAEPGLSAMREPVGQVHDDQTLDSAPQCVLNHLPPEEAARRLQRRFAIINFWRPIGSPVQNASLALCDARTIKPADLIPSDLVYPDWKGEIYTFAFSSRHRWYWYPRQRSSEATLFKVFDSSDDGCARLTAHTAFDDPRMASNAPLRRSIEMRALVFW